MPAGDAGVAGSASTSAASTSAATIQAAAAEQAAGENFPVALRLLPPRYRQHLAAVYGRAPAHPRCGLAARSKQRSICHGHSRNAAAPAARTA